VTPEQIEAILADFRDWLRDAAPAEAPPAAEPVDLHTLVAQFTALRQEVNLQTRAVRQQQEQNAETLRQLEAAGRQPAAPANDDQSRSLLNALIDVADTQQRAIVELRRVSEDVAQGAATVHLERRTSTALWAVLGIAREYFKTHSHLVFSAQQQLAASKRVSAAADGIEMGLQRIERAMKSHGLEPVAAIDRSFDPELMEAVEVVVTSEKQPGYVYDELRRGYLLNGRVFRFAQVRVCKAPQEST
jgi:molecular chaperone GrpE